MSDVRKAIISGAVSGVILSVVLVALVFATGSTFGQRCANHFSRDSIAWERCIDELSAGRPLPTPDRRSE